MSLAEMRKYIKDPALTDEQLLNLRDLLVEIAYMVWDDVGATNGNTNTGRMQRMPAGFRTPIRRTNNKNPR